MKKKCKQEGITLVALVITIIVLLILVGVTLGLLIQNNGLINKAQIAKIQNDRASAKEEIEIAVISSRMNNNVRIDTSILDTELNKIIGLEIESKGINDNLPWIVKVNRFQFQIKEDGTVEEIKGIVLSPTVLKMVEGQDPVTITATLAEGVTGNINWSSDNENIVTVNNGTVTLVGTSGTAKIIAKVEGTDYSAECTVIIVSKVTSIVVDDFEIMQGEEKMIQVKTIPSENIEDLTYTYESGSRVEIDDVGKVKGAMIGKEIITITGIGISGTQISTKCVVTIVPGPRNGDFVNYSAGNWTKTDFEKLGVEFDENGNITNNGELYAGPSLPTSSTPYKFGGFALGDSKDVSITPYETYTNTYSGWRILSKKDGIYTIIHAGTPEGYYSANKDISVYILRGEIDTNGKYPTRSVRDWSMYENETYAQRGKARSVRYMEMLSNQTGAHRTGSYFWVADLDVTGLRYFKHDGHNSFANNKCFGVRPVITLKPNVKLTAKEGDTTHTTEETAWQLEIE